LDQGHDLNCEGQGLATAVSGIILAGGASERLGRDKALIQLWGRPLIAHVAAKLALIVAKVVVVTNEPERYAFLGLDSVPDIYPGIGTLGGLHAGLSAVQSAYGLAVGCDMPFLSVGLLRYMIAQAPSHDVVMPRIGQYYEPLHAIYARRCLPAIEQAIAAGRWRLLSSLEGARIHYVEEEVVDRYDPQHLSFFNVNTPSDLERLRELEHSTPFLDP
jgi:molybdopterin-guanine dinucleotide biosynthesis protein A